MSSSNQSTPLKLDLKGYTAKQYAALILREDMGYSYGKAGIKLDKNYSAFARLYRRARKKSNEKNNK